MPLLAADPVTTLPAQRETLEQLVRGRSTPQQLALRARIILQAADNIGANPGERRCVLRIHVLLHVSAECAR